MNIGEISKPSVDRSEIKPKPKLPITSQVDLVPAVTDQVDLSSKARRRYQEYMRKRQQQKAATIQLSTPSQAEEMLDLNLSVNHSQSFKPPPNIDYGYLVSTEQERVFDANSRKEIASADPTENAKSLTIHIDLNV